MCIFSLNCSNFFFYFLHNYILKSFSGWGKTVTSFIVNGNIVKWGTKQVFGNYEIKSILVMTVIDVVFMQIRLGQVRYQFPKCCPLFCLNLIFSSPLYCLVYDVTVYDVPVYDVKLSSLDIIGKKIPSTFTTTATTQNLR